MTTPQERSRSIDVLTLAGLLIAQATFLTAIVLFVGTYDWDDGAITLAFARTLTETGKVALTPYSEQVEGFSSLSWLLVNAIPHLFGATFETAIRVSQLLTVAALAATTLVLSCVCENLGLTRRTKFFVLGCFILFGPCFSEAVNGMEMGLLALASTSITYLLTHDERTSAIGLLTAVAVFTTTRFEACFYVVFFALPLLLERRCSLFVKIGLASALTVFVVGMARWWLFGELVPNTVLAKMHAPYSTSGIRSAVETRVDAVAELPRLIVPALAVTWLISLLPPREYWRLRHVTAAFNNRHLHLLCPVVGALAFSAVTGKNWG